MPNYELRMEITELIHKYFVNSNTASDRQLFFDLARMGSKHFSQEYFHHTFSHLIVCFMKERSLAVAISFCHNVVDIKQGLSIILPPESQYDIPPSIIDDILGIFQERLSHKSKFLAALVSEQLKKVQSEEFKEFINSEEFRE